MTALTTVSAPALAVVHGVGGVAAIAGTLDAGNVVALASLLTRLYAPLTALASARADVVSAPVSFDRVVEVLDLVPPVRERPGARTAPEGPVGRVRGRAVRLPRGLRRLARLAGDVSFGVEPGQVVAIVGSSAAGESPLARLLARRYDVDHGVVRVPVLRR